MYEYSCKHCGWTWDQFESLADMDVPCDSPCPECFAEDTVFRVMNAPLVSQTFGLGTFKKGLPEDFKSRINQIKKEHPNGFKNSFL